MKDALKTGLEEEIEIAEGVKGELKEGVLKIEGKQGTVSRSFRNPRIKIEIVENKIKLRAKRVTKREKKLIGSLGSHIKNMIRGASEGYIYKLKICSGHFPMNVSISGKELIVKNFLGEKIPRKLKLKEGVKAKVEGDIITIESPDKELAGQVAADIEQLTRITNKDLRIFQDGCYIISKGGKETS